MNTAGWQTPKIYHDLISCSTQTHKTFMLVFRDVTGIAPMLWPFAPFCCPLQSANEWCLKLPLHEVFIQIHFLKVEQAITCDSTILTCSVCSLLLLASVCDWYFWLHSMWYLVSLLFSLFLFLNCMYCTHTVSFSSGSRLKILWCLYVWHYLKLCVAQYWDSPFIVLYCWIVLCTLFICASR